MFPVVPGCAWSATVPHDLVPFCGPLTCTTCKTFSKIQLKSKFTILVIWIGFNLDALIAKWMITPITTFVTVGVTRACINTNRLLSSASRYANIIVLTSKVFTKFDQIHQFDQKIEPEVMTGS